MSPSTPLPVVVLGSGRGSNFAALERARSEGRCHIAIAAVISDREGAPILSKAEVAGIESRVVRFDRQDRVAWDLRLADAVAEYTPGFIVLAGFMRILGPGFVGRFEGRILNVHPSLLPAFPGANAPAQALAAGVEETGCTVHIVDEGVDTGPVLAQRSVPVVAGDTPQSLHTRIQGVEHELLPSVLDALARGELTAPCGS